MQYSLIDYLPFWGLFTATVAFVLLSVEAGFQLGRYRSRQPEHEHHAPVGSVVSASLVLLAFILAFTFGMTVNRFQERRDLVLDDATAIEKVYLYARLLPEQTSKEVRTLVKEYVGVAVEMRLDPKNLKQGIARSERLQNALWSQTVAVSQKAASPVMAALFVKSLSQMIDARTKRLDWTLRHRIPDSIWATLYVVAAFGMALMGYQTGLSGARSLLSAFWLGLAFSAVILLIAILDRPETTYTAVSQQAMIDLQTRITSR